MRIGLHACLMGLLWSFTLPALAQVTAGVANNGKEILDGGMIASLDKGQEDGVQDGDEFDLLDAAGGVAGRARVVSAQGTVSFIALTDFIGTNAIVPASRFRKRPARAATAELTLQAGHSNDVRSLAFTADGSELLTQDMTSLKVWDVRTGELLLTREAPLFSTLMAVAASPTTGGPAVTGDAFGALRFWNPSTFRIDKTILAHLRNGKAETVTRLGFLPDGKTLFSAGEDNIISIWDIANLVNATPTRTFLAFDAGGSTGFNTSISPDGEYLAVSVKDLEKVAGQFEGVCKVHLLRVSDGSTVRAPLCGNGVDIQSLALGPGGLIAAEAFGGSLLIWSTDMRQPPLKIALTAQNDPAFTIMQGDPIVMLPDGKTVAVTDAGGLRLIATTDGSSRMLPCSSNMSSLAVSRDGTKIAAGRKDGSITVWEVSSGHILKNLPGAQAGRELVAWSSSGDGIAANVKDGRIQLWDMTSGQFDRTLIIPKDVSDLADMRYSPDGKSLAVSGYQGISVINLATGKSSLIVPTGGAFGHKTAMAYSPRGSYLAFSIDGFKAVLWDLKAGHQAATFDTLDGIDSSKLDLTNPLEDGAEAFRFSADEKTLWHAQGVGGAAAWSIADGHATALWSQTIPPGEAVDISADGKFVAVTSGAGLKVYDLGQRKIVQTFQTVAPAVPVVRFANSKNLLAFVDGPMAQVWDMDLKRLVRNFIHSEFVSDVRFSPDDRLLLTNDRSDQLSLWELYHPGRLARMMTLGDRDWLTFDETGFFDGTRSAWNLATFHTTDKPLQPYYPEQFFNLFYQPGLLSTVKNERTMVRSYLLSRGDPRGALDIGDYVGSTLPVVSVSAPGSSADGRAQLVVSVKDAGSGVRDCRIFRNGQMIDTRDGPLSPPSFASSVELSTGRNVLGAYCFNAKGIRSQTSSTTVMNDHAGASPTAFIIAAGVNDYHNPKMKLQNAEADAKDLSDALGARLSGRYKVVIVYLPSSVATRNTIISALEHLRPGAASLPAGSPLHSLRPAGPDDLVTFVFAGHGMQSGDHFYVLPTDQGYTGEPDALDDPHVLSAVKDAVAAHSVSDGDLAQALATVQAGRIMMIVDACNSGGLLGSARLGPFNSASFSQLAYDKGVYVLAAAQSREAAREGYKDAHGNTHGYLTYALLEGLDRAPRYEASPGRLSAEEWFDYAIRRVGELTSPTDGGKQHPQDYTPSADGAPLWIEQ